MGKSLKGGESDPDHAGLHGSAGLKPFCDHYVCLRHLRDAGVEEIQWLSLLNFWRCKRFMSLCWAATRCIETERVILFELSHTEDGFGKGGCIMHVWHTNMDICLSTGWLWPLICGQSHVFAWV